MQNRKSAHIDVTTLQLQIAQLCGISLNGLSKTSAAALLSSKLAEDVLGVLPALPTTDAQRSIATQLKIAKLSEFREIAALQIKAEFVRLNDEAMNKHEFTKDMRVRFVGGPHVHQLAYEVGAVFQISTVKPDGRVYFKGTVGAGAYASQLVPV